MDVADKAEDVSAVVSEAIEGNEAAESDCSESIEDRIGHGVTSLFCADASDRVCLARFELDLADIATASTARAYAFQGV